MNTLEQLSQHSIIVADTGEFDQIAKFKPTDSTTNPSLILQAAKQPQYQAMIDSVLRDHKSESVEQLFDRVCVSFGLEILKLIDGRVSTEVAADLSFDSDKCIVRAQNIIQLYEANGIDRERVLIKLAATWEGMQAAEQLEQQGIHCNLTLLFSFAQAVVCAQKKVQLISPFVGRILDWHQAKNPDTVYNGQTDPGVISVKQIYNYYKKFDIKTEVMAASFRNTDEILALAGCDLLTIHPKFLAVLKEQQTAIKRQLSIENATDQCHLDRQSYSEAEFRLQCNRDQMAVEKLSQGINSFIADQVTLQNLIQLKIDA